MTTEQPELTPVEQKEPGLPDTPEVRLAADLMVRTDQQGYAPKLEVTPKQVEKAIVQRVAIAATDRGLKLDSLESMWRFCTAVVNSGTFKDINTPEIALIRLQAGLELGLTPIWSLTNIMVVNGRPSVWGDAFLGIVLRQPDCQDVIETFEGDGDDLTAVCEVHRRGRLPVARKFSVKDAKRAGLHGKNVHALYPSRMLQMRARAWACRDAFADALRGLGVIEEQNGIDHRATVVEKKEEKIVLPDEVK